jgi:hypothetical protein
MVDQEDEMKTIRTIDLPDNPRDEEWPQAAGPDGQVSVDRVDEPFQLDDEPPRTSGWVVWSEAKGYRSVDDDTFEDDYEMNGPAPLPADPGSTDSFGLG